MIITQDDITLFVEAIKSVSDYDFSEYSIKSFTRRIEKILVDYKTDLPLLTNRIRHDDKFLEQIVKDITVNTTELFRDPKVWQTIKYRILTRLNDQDKISIWHAGCSTGQEVYSMQILLNELGLLEKSDIFATDINVDVLDVARKGEYIYRFNVEYLENFDKVIKQNPFNESEFFEVPYEKYFDIDKSKDTIKVKPFLKQKPTFFKHDLVKDGDIFHIPFDMILCRNVLIYFNYELQNKIFELFYQYLKEEGSLILGIHESILGPKATKYTKKGLYYTKK